MGVFVRQSPPLPFSRMVRIECDTSAQWLDIDVQAGDSGWHRLEEHSQANFDLDQFAQAGDGSVANAQPVAFFGSEVLGCSVRVEMTDAPTGRIPSGNSGLSSSQQVEVVIGELFQAADYCRQELGLSG